MIILSDMEIFLQALNNLGKMYKGRTQTIFLSLAKEIRRLHAAQEKAKQRESTRRYRANEEAKRHGADLPYPEEDIPF